MGEFGKLWTASTISSLGDGVTRAAGPLLAASLTRDPVQIAGLMVAEQLPWTLLALPSGVLVDRVDRRLLLTLASVVRVAALGLLGLLVASGRPALIPLYVAFLLAGCAGVLYENASMTVLPAAVGHAGLDRANGRMLASRTLGQALLGPPLAGWLFALAAWVPFVLDASAFVLVAALCVALSAAVGRIPAGDSRPTLRAALAEGIRWLARHRLLRAVAITVAVENLTLGAGFAVMVLIAQQRLGLGSVGYGLLLTASGVGGIAGGLLTSRIVGAIGPGTALRTGLVVETLCFAGLAVTRHPVLGAGMLAVLGLHLVMFSTINATLRQSLAPPGMLGRVHSAYRLISAGGMLLGAALGGVVARWLGLTAPFWLGAAGVVVVTACVWRVLNNRDIEATRSAARSALGADAAPVDHRPHD